MKPEGFRRRIGWWWWFWWWWFQILFIFTPILGEDEPILTNIFQMGWFNHQPDFGGGGGGGGGGGDGGGGGLFKRRTWNN